MTELSIIRITLLSSCMIACSDSTLVGESKTTSKNFEKVTILDQGEKDPIVNPEQTNNEDHTTQENRQQDAVPPEQDPEIIEEEELVSIPAMTTGAYLVSCAWQVEGLSFACEINSYSQSETGLNFVLKDDLGTLIPSEFYNIEATFEEGLVIILVSLESDIPSWSLEGADSKGIVEVDVSDEMILTTAETELKSPDLSKVVAFSEANFEGHFIEYSLGKYDLEISDVSSIRIPLGYAVEVCDSARCAGFYGDVSDLLSFSDSVLSMNIYESVPFITVFDENNFGGVHQIFPVAIYLRSDLLAGIGDDKISSCHVPAGLRVKFCEHPRGGGLCDFFTSSVDQLGVELNNDVTHIEVSENTSLSITP